MGDDIVQLAGDACAFPPRRVLEQGAGDGLAGGAVLHGLAARPVRGPGPGRRRSERGQQHGGNPGLSQGRGGEREHQEGQGQARGQQLRAVAPEPVQDGQLGQQARDGQRPEGRERQHAGRGDGRRGRRRLGPQETERHRRGQADQHHDHDERPVHAAGARARGQHGPGLGCGERSQERCESGGRVRGGGHSPSRLGPSSAPVAHEAHVRHCRWWSARRRHPWLGIPCPPCEGCASARRPPGQRQRRPLRGVTTSASPVP